MIKKQRSGKPREKTTVPSFTATLLKLESPKGNLQLIVYHQNSLRRNLVVMGERSNGFTAEVHIRMGFNQDHIGFSKASFEKLALVSVM